MMSLRTALLALIAVAAPAQAGDVANLNILGFSADGSVFAFEEYGIFDGSGFPYANRFYIDTETDQFLPGSPVRVRLEDEQATLDQARGQARYQAEGLVPAAVLAANPGFTAGFNAITEYSADPMRMMVNPRPIFHPVDPPLEFRLEEVPLNGTESCRNHGDINGFRLIRIDPRDGGQTQFLHEEQSIPESRGCPHSYRIGAVQTFEVQHSLTAFAVLIAVGKYGFEGPDYRWIAVTGRF